MIKLQQLLDDGYEFFTGVPDSGLKPLINEIIESGVKHVIATNEGQAIGIAAGAELAGKKSCVYLQNSGLGTLYVYILDNGCHESVGKYKCSELEDSYSGITDIIKISNDGKAPRVELGCIDNTNQIKELF
jgi:acyl CoA:acetate/3-ketoacid CoA transferase alpha subunit